MADDINTPQTPDQAHLGRPVSGWKTTLTKLLAVTGFAVSAVSVGMGALVLVKKGEIAEGILDDLKNHSKFAHTSLKEAENFAIKSGVAMLGLGTIGGIASGATLQSANSASRARNYIQLSQQLNGQGAGQQR